MTLSALIKNYEGEDRDLIEQAYAVAESFHHGQKRASGEPYIIHPLAVAAFLADLGFDAHTVSAGLLHDLLEDTPITKEGLERRFGTEVTKLVDGVTKLSAFSSRARERASISDLQTESLKKMFFAMAEDLRVIIIKLADRLHNMKTLGHKSPESRQRIAKQTMDIYAPIAARLGMGHLKGELEDLAFPYAYPTEYSWLKKTIKGKYEQRLKYIERTAPVVAKTLRDAGVTVLNVNSRAKRMWSLYSKLKRYDMDPDKVMDLVALRIVVPDVRACYEALGIIHAHYKPLPGRVKDYIALPKPNGYRSLHTTVFCEKGKIAEIQIRTPDMHDHAENGIAAHWSYAEAGKRSVSAKQQELAWVNQLKTHLKEIKSSQGLADLKIDFFKDRIFALTPEGDIKDLPENATPLDFAYAVHSELGHRTTGAIVNGRIVALASSLQSGDVVEIIKGKEARPNKDWLRIAITNQARKHIASWLKKHDPSMIVADGRIALNRELARMGLSLDKLNRRQILNATKAHSSKSLDDLLTHIGVGDYDAAVVARSIAPAQLLPQGIQRKIHRKGTGIKPTPTKATLSRIIIDQQPGLAYRVGHCCNPTAPSLIVGYLTLARGVTVHHHDCQNIKTASSKRLLVATWGE